MDSMNEQVDVLCVRCKYGVSVSKKCYARCKSCAALATMTLRGACKDHRRMAKKYDRVNPGHLTHIETTGYEPGNSNGLKECVNDPATMAADFFATFNVKFAGTVEETGEGKVRGPCPRARKPIKGSDNIRSSRGCSTSMRASECPNKPRGTAMPPNYSKLGIVARRILVMTDILEHVRMTPSRRRMQRMHLEFLKKVYLRMRILMYPI